VENVAAEQFEELLAWQKASVLTTSSLELSDRPVFARNRALVDQLQRASVSVMSDIAERFGRGPSAECHQFLVIAQASCAGVRSLEYVACDRGSVDAHVSNNLPVISRKVAKVREGLRSAAATQRDERWRRPQP
jgi:four helix bundle protein